MSDIWHQLCLINEDIKTDRDRERQTGRDRETNIQLELGGEYIKDRQKETETDRQTNIKLELGMT